MFTLVSLRQAWRTIRWSVVVSCLAVPANAQTASAPTYISIPQEISVDRPAGEVWPRIAKYCTVSTVLSLDCKVIAGNEGEVGAVRQVSGTILEIIVGRTALSYTYAAAVRAGQPYNMYHGTIEVRPITATTSKILYTLVYDNSTLADEAAREKDRASKVAIFTKVLAGLKAIAER
jgi:hypothetical protein